MGRPLTHDAARELDRAILDAATLAAQNDGEQVPCRDHPAPIAAAWADEDDERAQVLAALACAGCAVLTECRTYGLTHREEVGVYGGLTHAQRRPRRGRPPRTNAA